MKYSTTFKAASLVLASTFLLSACSGEEKLDSAETTATEDSNKTRLDFNLQGEDADGNVYNVDGLQVVVTNSADEVMFDETINVVGPDETFSLDLTLPAGSGYNVSVTGNGSGEVDTDGDGTLDAVVVPCNGEATFDAPSAGPVQLSLLCLAPGADTATGNVDVDADFTFERRDECGVLSVFAAPTASQTEGGLITLNATGTEDVAFSWSVSPAEAGSFADDAVAATSFDCESNGPATITLTVTNDDADCNDEVEIPIECLSASICGNDIQEPGEQCDGTDVPNAGDECNASCRLVECGDGDVEGSEVCDDGGTVDGDDTNGDGVGCSADCSAVEECGDNIVQPGLGEECDPVGSVDPSTGDECQPGCVLPVAPTCDECTASECTALEAECSSQATCPPVLDCFEQTGCSIDNGEYFFPCLCGTAEEIDCLTGQGNGACLAVMNAAASASNSGTSLQRLNDSDYALGDAQFLGDCQRTTCRRSCWETYWSSQF